MKKYKIKKELFGFISVDLCDGGGFLFPPSITEKEIKEMMACYCANLRDAYHRARFT